MLTIREVTKGWYEASQKGHTGGILIFANEDRRYKEGRRLALRVIYDNGKILTFDQRKHGTNCLPSDITIKGVLVASTVTAVNRKIAKKINREVWFSLTGKYWNCVNRITRRR